MTGEQVDIKGTSDGLVITIGQGSLDSVLDDMQARLHTKASFFVGGRVALRVGDRPLTVEQIRSIGTALEEAGVTLWAVEGSHPRTREAALELGLEAGMQPSSRRDEPQSLVDPEDMVGITVRRTLRSGQAIRHAGHVTLIGDVNPGAELVADGDIVIWGKLRGMVHAGAMGDEGAIICALELAPNQIRIGRRIARPPDLGRSPATPEIARIHEGRIVVDRWNLGRRAGLKLRGWRFGPGNLSVRVKSLLGRGQDQEMSEDTNTGPRR